MADHFFRILTALCGIVGGITLAYSFAANPSLPPTATISQMIAYANRNRNKILIAAWLQGIGSLLVVLFILALVHQAGATQRFAGWVTLLSGAALLMISLVEISFYILSVQAAATGDAVMGTIAEATILAIHHIFLIAPALLLPLGIVLLGSNVLPHLFGYLAIVLGATLQVLGLMGLFNLLQPLIDNLLIVQNVWIVTAGIALLFRLKSPNTQRDVEAFSLSTKESQ